MLVCAPLCHRLSPTESEKLSGCIDTRHPIILRRSSPEGDLRQRPGCSQKQIWRPRAAQDDYAQLAAHFGFEAAFCNPASGNEKGLVENLVGYIRRNVCFPLPRVETLDMLNGKLLEQCARYLDHQIEGRAAHIGEMLAEEPRELRPIPKYTLDTSKKFYPVVGRYSTVIAETNQDSVPCGISRTKRNGKAYPNHIEIWIKGRLFATHTRLYGRKQESLEIQHDLPILAQKAV